MACFKMVYAVRRNEPMKILRKGKIAGYDGRTGHYWPSVARLPNGDLAAVWSGGRKNHICPFGKLMISCSSDEGKTWTCPDILLNSPLDDRDGGICVKGESVLVTTFNNTRKFQRESLHRWPDGRPEGEGAQIEAYLNSVTDEQEKEWFGSLCAVGDGRKLGTFRKIPLTSPHGAIVRKNEFLYVGRSFMDEEGVSPFGLEEGIYYMSSDDGVTWSSPVKAPPARDGAFLCEPHAFECADGSVFVAARSHAAGNYDEMSLYFNRIRNGNFEQWQPTGIVGAPPHFLRLNDGRVLLVYGRRKAPFGVRAKISSDDGASWSEEMCLSEDAPDWDVGYPSSVQLKNGNILTVWYQHCGTDRLASVVYQEWEI